MQFDLKRIRALLESAAESEKLYTRMPKLPVDDCVLMKFLEDARLIDFWDFDSDVIYRITSAGLDFLYSINEPVIWEKIKDIEINSLKQVRDFLERGF